MKTVSRSQTLNSLLGQATGLHRGVCVWELDALKTGGERDDYSLGDKLRGYGNSSGERRWACLVLVI